MNYWITSHWPPRSDRAEQDRTARWRWWVFLSDEYPYLGRDVRPGDRVLIYETQCAPRLIKGRKLIDYETGRKGIIAVATIGSKMKENKTAVVENHEDGRRVCWKYYFRTRSIKRIDVPLHRIRKALGYKQRYGLRMPGGLRRLTRDQFDLLLEMAK